MIVYNARCALFCIQYMYITSMPVYAEVRKIQSPKIKGRLVSWSSRLNLDHHCGVRFLSERETTIAGCDPENAIIHTTILTALAFWNVNKAYSMANKIYLFIVEYNILMNLLKVKDFFKFFFIQGFACQHLTCMPTFNRKLKKSDPLSYVPPQFPEW